MTEPITFKNAPISVFQQAGMNGQPSRRLFITVEDLNTIPDELFAVKVSQSKNPELAGKSVFKYFSYKVDENAPFSALAPSGTTMATPTAETKAAVVAKLGSIAGAKFSVAINMNGKFANIATPDGTYTIYDDKEFPATEGKPGYYIKAGSLADVEITKGESQYGPYYKVALSTDMTPDELFVRAGKSKVWGAEAGAGAADVATDEVNDGGVW